ncbi:MAG TPA: pentapeptide repeat-containing protein, partial [Nitrospiria bacterium]|nr:pentapeptide repeat-containing protein [Nitrospiria bacterium]
MKQAGNDDDAAFHFKVLTQAGSALLVLLGVYFVFGEIYSAGGNQAEERLDDSVKLLESEDIQTRLNGIYSLERIANNSRKDHWPIMEILTAYIRTKAPCIRFPGGNNACLTAKNPIPKQPADLQAVLYVIGRRKTEYEIQEGHRFINLSNTDLRGAFLARAPLINAYFSGSNLEEAELYAANLSGAVFTGWNQGGLSLPSAIVDHADFRAATLDGTRFEGVDLSKAKNILPDRLEKACLNTDTIFPLKREYEYLTEYIKTDKYRRMHKRV